MQGGKSKVDLFLKNLGMTTQFGFLVTKAWSILTLRPARCGPLAGGLGGGTRTAYRKTKMLRNVRHFLRLGGFLRTR